MKLATFTKQPAERLSKSITYAEALDALDEVTTVESCIAEPAGLTVTPVLVSGQRVRIWIQGGEDMVAYKITLTVSTAGGEIFQDELICKVREV